MLKLDPSVARDWHNTMQKTKSSPKRLTETLTRGLKGVVGVNAREIDDLLGNLVILEEYLSFSAIKVMGNIAIDLLSHSQPRVPYETGELRESGRALILFGGRYSKIVGRGTRDGSVDADLSALKGRQKGLKYIAANVTYRRTNEFGDDIALWAHEELLPHSRRQDDPRLGRRSGKSRPLKSVGKAYAKQPGTGPKFLELAYLERKGQYIDWIKDAFSYQQIERDIRRGLRVKKTGTEYRVDTVKLKRFF